MEVQAIAKISLEYIPEIIVSKGKCVGNFNGFIFSYHTYLIL